MKKFFSEVFIFFGALCLVLMSYYIWQRYNPNRLAFAVTTMAPTQRASSQLPRTIQIPEIDIKLPILPARVTKGKWPATDKGVSYLSHSPRPGERGNSVLYGHNFPNLLGKLTEIKPGMKIVITFNNQEKKTFVTEYTSVVTPDQTHILNPSKDTRITLYTCTGFFDVRRFVVTALLEDPNPTKIKKQ